LANSIVVCPLLPALSFLYQDWISCIGNLVCVYSLFIRLGPSIALITDHRTVNFDIGGCKYPTGGIIYHI